MRSNTACLPFFLFPRDPVCWKGLKPAYIRDCVKCVWPEALQDGPGDGPGPACGVFCPLRELPALGLTLLCLVRRFVGVLHCEPFIGSVLVLFPVVFSREMP